MLILPSYIFIFVAMKFAIITFVVLAAASVNGEEVLDRAVLEDNGMNGIKEIIGDIHDMSKGAEDLNVMEARLQGLEEEAEAVYRAREILTSNMDKTKLGIHSKDNSHPTKTLNNEGEWVNVN